MPPPEAALEPRRLLAFAVLSWQVVNCVEYVLHTASHVRIDLPILRTMHRVHMQHHKQHYPVSHLLRDGPYRDGGGAWVYGPIAALFCAVIWRSLRPQLAAIMLAEMALFQVVARAGWGGGVMCDCNHGVKPVCEGKHCVTMA